jgi:hypothetical protein
MVIMAPMPTPTERRKYGPGATGQAKTARLHQRIRADLKLKIRREAHRRVLDETSIVTIALVEYFEKHGEPPPIPDEDDTPAGA